MEITIDEAIDVLEYLKTQNSQLLSLDVAINTMRKYQKIQDTYEKFQKDGGYYQDMARLVDALGEVVEDGSN